MVRAAVLTCQLVAMAACATAAQDTTAVVLGETIRVTSHYGRFEARFDGVHDDTLFVSRGETVWHIAPLDSLAMVEARRCCRSKGDGRKRGAIFGWVAGTAVGVGTAFLACKSDRYVCDGDSLGSLTLFVLSRSAIGAIVGAVWGNFRTGQTWMPVSLPELEIGSTLEGKPRIGLSLEIEW